MKTFQDGDPLFGAMMHAIANLWPNGTAVLSGCAPTGSGSARQVTVAAGTVAINGAVVSVSQQTKTLDAASFDRYDLVSINTSGTAVVTKGVDARRVPPVPANSVPIAICLVETGQAALPADRIYDARMDALRLSVLNIDADKDWGGRTISNVVLDGSSKSTLVIARASDTLRASSDAQVFFYSGMTKAKEIQLSSRLYGSDNTFRVKFDLRARYSEYEGHAQIYVNDSPRGTHRSKYGSSFTTFSEDITGLKAGDKIQLYTELAYVANFRIYADYYGVLVPVAPSHTVIL